MATNIDTTIFETLSFKDDADVRVSKRRPDELSGEHEKRRRPNAMDRRLVVMAGGTGRTAAVVVI